MLKTTLAASLAASIEVRDKKQNGKKIQVENWDKKKSVEPVKKNCKS